MFQTDKFSGDNESRENRPDGSEAVADSPRRQTSLTFTSEAAFGEWIDVQLELLVAEYAEFETQDSLRGFFKR